MLKLANWKETWYQQESCQLTNYLIYLTSSSLCLSPNIIWLSLWEENMNLVYHCPNSIFALHIIVMSEVKAEENYFVNCQKQLKKAKLCDSDWHAVQTWTFLHITFSCPLSLLHLSRLEQPIFYTVRINLYLI